MPNKKQSKEWEEFEIEIYNILEPYFVVLDGRDNDPAENSLIELSAEIREKVSQNFIPKLELKEILHGMIKISDEVERQFGRLLKSKNI